MWIVVEIYSGSYGYFNPICGYDSREEAYQMADWYTKRYASSQSIFKVARIPFNMPVPDYKV